MKASEIVNRYANGERNFRGVNLRGLSFKGQDLSGADFTGADIRGTNFAEALLVSTNFSGAKGGLQRRWFSFLLLVSLLLVLFSGFWNGISGAFVFYLFSPDLGLSNIEAIAFNLTYLLTLVIFFVITIRQGLIAGLGILLVAVAAAVAGVTVVAAAVAGVTVVTVAGVTVAVAVAAAVAGVTVVVVALALAAAVAGVTVVTVALALAAAVAGVTVVAVAVVVLFVLLSSYISWRAMKGDFRDAWIRNFAIAFAATGGTSFYKANLTDANFTGAKLKSTDLREANLTRTCWRNVQNLDQVRPGKTYLEIPQLHKWLINKQGTKKNFDRLDLRGVYLQGANLKEMSFIGADLSEANLKDADLSRAKLVQTQLDKTDLTGATLTGAYIQNWGITSQTIFTGVRCEYVYMRLPTIENPDPWRKPDNYKEVFADEEFGDFINPIVDTLDLYHNQDVDPRAIAISFKKLAENNPDAELEIVALERRGTDQLLLRAESVDTVDKSQLTNDYFEIYNSIINLSKSELALLFIEKNTQINLLEKQVNISLQAAGKIKGFLEQEEKEFIPDNYEKIVKEVDKKYRDELKAKDDELETYRQEISNLRKIVDTLTGTINNHDSRVDKSSQKNDLA